MGMANLSGILAAKGKGVLNVDLSREPQLALHVR